MNINQLNDMIKKSAFNKQKYVVNIPVRRLIPGVMLYMNENVEPTSKNLFDIGVPEFQRSNDKWSRNMQISFVENVIKGYNSKIQLYTLNQSVLVDCKILDGLQRTTSLTKFIDGEFNIFNDEVSFNDIKDNILRGLNVNIGLEIFSFKDQNEAIDFYVEMNENITHSAEDINKALKFKTK